MTPLACKSFNFSGAVGGRAAGGQRGGTAAAGSRGSVAANGGVAGVVRGGSTVSCILDQESGIAGLSGAGIIAEPAKAEIDPNTDLGESGVIIGPEGLSSIAAFYKTGTLGSYGECFTTGEAKNNPMYKTSSNLSNGGVEVHGTGQVATGSPLKMQARDIS